MSKFRYMRVSTTQQSVARQEDDSEYQAVFIEKASAKSRDDRPQLELMLKVLGNGDVVHVASMDRLARNLSDLESIVNEITAKGASIVFEKENLTFNQDENLMSELMLRIIGAVAQFERQMIVARANEGRAVAKAKGKHMGRRSALTQSQVEEIKAKLREGFSGALLAKQYGVSRPTIYKVRDDEYKVV